jgi:hypothetical protein
LALTNCGECSNLETAADQLKCQEFATKFSLESEEARTGLFVHLLLLLNKTATASADGVGVYLAKRVNCPRIGIDVRKVAVMGIGMVGAGVLRAAAQCFAEAFEMVREW